MSSDFRTNSSGDSTTVSYKFSHDSPRIGFRSTPQMSLRVPSGPAGDAGPRYSGPLIYRRSTSTKSKTSSFVTIPSRFLSLPSAASEIQKSIGTVGLLMVQYRENSFPGIQDKLLPGRVTRVPENNILSMTFCQYI
jgi:hypothetical protein